MHILEQYALNSGAKIKDAFIYEQFFPITVEKYITFHPVSKPSKTYDYWQEVINMIVLILEKNNIKIIQLGHENEKVYQNVLNTVGMTSVNQTAYIIKNALLHFGTDSFPTHVASHYKKKIVSLYSNNYISCVKPYFGDSKDHILLEPEREGKPNFSFEESPKTINRIKPELIAKNILNLLNIPAAIEIETKYFGSNYNQPKLELVPNVNIDPKQFNSNLLIVRMDLEYNLQILENQLNICPCYITTDKVIDAQLLIRNKNNIKKIFYQITKDNNIDFVNFLEANSIPFELFTLLKDKDLDEVKIKYLDHQIITEIRTDNKERINLSNLNNLYFKSNKRIVSKGKIFNSETYYKKDTEMKSEFEQIVDCEDFWKEAEDFWILKLDK